jgi:hypothetical protein
MLAKKLLITWAGALILWISASQTFALDAWDPGDDTGTGATPITVSETLQEHGPHTTTSQSDIADWFSVSLTAGILYHFESTGDDDMEAFLYSDAEGVTQVAYNDDKVEWVDYSFYITYSPTTSGIYFLKVKHLFNANSSYSLSYYADPPPTDGWDPDDDSGAGATVLTIDEVQRTNGIHVLSSGDLEDWFRFALVAGNTYRFESSGNWDVQASLYSDEAGTAEVASDDQSGADDNFLIDYKPSVSGDYYLKVTVPVSGNFADYTLNYIMVEDQWDPGDDTGSGATVLAATTAEQMHGPHTLSTNDLSDWFQIAMVAGSTYYLETTVADPVEQDTRGTLYSDSAGTNQVAIDDDSGEFDNFRIVYTPSVSGDYYLLIEELYSKPAGYWLKYSKDANGDADGDGMLDSWEIHHFGSTNALPDDFSGDEDMFSNLQEFIAGTDPTNSDSFFAITNWSPGSFVVEWPAFSNRQYRVYRADSMTNLFNPISPVILYPQNSYTDTAHSAEDSGFYKVEVQVQ